jgi:serine/threonine protein kinase
MEPRQRQEQDDQPTRRVRVACPGCQQGYRIAARLIGRRLVCRHCRHEWRAYEAPSSEIRRPPEVTEEAPSDSTRAVLPEDLPPVAGSSSTVIDTSWVGRTLGRYRIVSILGHGGMGVVWRAHDDTLRRDVALKILNRPRKGPGCINTELFKQEAWAVAKLQHPAVVVIYEVAEDHGQIFLALELMEGGTLKERIDRSGPIPPRELFEMMVGPARALALAHKRGIIHRDIKPGNLMFDDHEHLKLMDFGLAEVAMEPASERMRGKAVGSLGWVAPETVRGKGTTAASDIYGMGLVMLYALTGRPWLHASSRSRLIALHQNPPELDLSGITGLTPRGAWLLRKCLAVEQADRFASADDLATALETCAAEDPGEVIRRRKSHAYVAVAASIFGLLMGVYGGVKWFQHLEEQQAMLAIPLKQTSYTPAPPTSPTPRGGEAPSPGLPAGSAFATLPEGEPCPELAGSAEPWPKSPRINPKDLVCYGSVKSRSYHQAGSECGRQVPAGELVNFSSEKKARDAGWKPCPYCRRKTPDYVMSPNDG